jgi:hypothetical protein
MQISRLQERIKESSKKDLIHRLKSIIDEDKNISPEYKSELFVNANLANISTFLARVFLHSLRQINVVKEIITNNNTSAPCIQPDLPRIAPPEKIKSYENQYSSALFDIYGQKENINNFSLENLEKYSTLKNHFTK